MQEDAKPSNSFRNWLILWLVVGLLLRLSNVFTLDANLYSDEPAYDAIARNLVAGKGFSEGNVYAYRYPGYVVFLAGMYSVFGPSRIPIVVTQAFFGAGTLLLFALIVRRRLGDTAALFAAAALAVYVPFVRLPSRLYTENVFFLLLMSIWWILERPGNRLRVREAVAAGVLGGLAILTREVFLALSLLYVLVRLFSDRRGGEFGEKTSSLGPLLVYLSVSVLVVCPWTVRNYLLFGRFVPVTTNSWTNIYMGNNPQADGRYPAGKEPPGIWKPPPGEEWTGKYLEIDQMDYQKRAVLRFWRERPMLTAELAVRKAALSWAPPFLLDVTLSDTKAKVASGVWSGMFLALIALSAFGFIRGAPALRGNVWPYVLLVAPTLIAMLSYVIARYRFPAELALIFFASNGYIAALSTLPDKRMRDPSA